MKFAKSLVVIILLVGCSTHSRQSERLPSECLQTQKFANALHQLRKIDWNILDRKLAKSIWKERLQEDYECSTSIGNKSIPCMLLSDGPCDANSCCGILFDFDIPSDQPERIDSVIINLTSNQPNALTDAAKKFHRALSPMSKEADSDGDTFGWESINPKIIDDLYNFQSESSGIPIGAWLLVGQRPDGTWLLHLSMGPKN